MLGDWNNANDSNKMHSAWIGMGTSRYCTNNYSDFFWISSNNQVLNVVNPDLNVYMGEFDQLPYSTAVYAQHGGTLRNIDFNISMESFICECVCNDTEVVYFNYPHKCSSNMSNSTGTTPFDSCNPTTSSTTTTVKATESTQLKYSTTGTVDTNSTVSTIYNTTITTIATFHNGTTTQKLTTTADESLGITNQILNTNSTPCSILCPSYAVYKNGKCYILSNVSETWSSALNSCTNMNASGQNYCRLATFNFSTDLSYVSSAFLSVCDDDNDNINNSAVYTAWIGMKSNCLCSNNYQDFIWVNTANEPLSVVGSDINIVEINLQPYESCIYARSDGKIRNDKCNDTSNRRRYICECFWWVNNNQVCDGDETPMTGSINCTSNLSSATDQIDSCYTTTIMTTNAASTSTSSTASIGSSRSSIDTLTQNTTTTWQQSTKATIDNVQYQTSSITSVNCDLSSSAFQSSVDFTNLQNGITTLQQFAFSSTMTNWTNIHDQTSPITLSNGDRTLMQPLVTKNATTSTMRMSGRTNNAYPNVTTNVHSLGAAQPTFLGAFSATSKSNPVTSSSPVQSKSSTKRTYANIQVQSASSQIGNNQQLTSTEGGASNTVGSELLPAATTSKTNWSYSNSDCFIGQWTEFSACSETCGLSARKIRTRLIVLVKENSTCPNSNETMNCNFAKCNPMSPTAQLVAQIMQGLGCSWLIGLCAGCLLVSILLRSWNMNRFIHASQEIALIMAHILIATARNETRNFVVCTWTSIAIQYFFIVLFAFLVLEAVQVYTLVTTVVSSGTFFGFSTIASLGWGSQSLAPFILSRIICFPLSGLPFLVVAGTALSSYKHYTSTFTCWLNFENKISFGTIVPIVACCCLIVVLIEATGQRSNGDLHFGNSDQIVSARINQKSLLIITALQVAAWFFGQSAVYYQNIALFSTVFGLNLALGICICLFHVMANAEGRAFVMQMWKKIKPRRMNKVKTNEENSNG